MEENIKVTCPGCKTVLIIRRRDGKILETREPLLKESTGDRFEDAFKKVKSREKEVGSKVENIRRKEQEKLKTADDFFKQALERARQSEDKPDNPLDYD